MSKDTEAVGHARQQDQIIESTSRVAGVEELDQEARDEAHAAIAKIKSHETLCTERWEQARAGQIRVELALASLQKVMDERIGKVPAAIIAALMGLVGWLAARAFPLH